jgi:Protein of unknown function (DUF3460)
MSLFLPSRHYISEHTRFIREFLADKPEVVADQQKGRAIWWDKRPKDLAEETKMDEGRVAQTPYVYPDE